MAKYLKTAFSLILMAYLAVGLTMTARQSDDDVCRSMTLEVNGGDGFVSPDELARELDGLPARAKGMALANINTQQIRRTLLALDKIEDVQALRYTDGTVRITVTPIVPVLRVFDGPDSYYVNRVGKRVKASARYRKSVPVVQGHFDPADTLFTPLSLMPLIHAVTSDSVWNTYIGAIHVKSPTDILLIPNIREHVVNLGSLDDLDSKLQHLRTFYSQVLLKQGWEKYDTISLKWRGQIVATKRHRAGSAMPTVTHDDDESVAIDAMLAGDGVAPGRTRPGQAAHSERPIPAKKPA